MRLTLIATLAVLIAPAVASAACDVAGTRPGSRSARAHCPEAKRFEPYDPDRVRPGGRPGQFSAGNTEIRVGGRTRVEYQYTR